MDFRNKHIVITGATSGIGLDLLKRLARLEGVRICAVARSENKLNKISKRYAVKTVACDLSDKTQVDAMLRNIHTRDEYWGGNVDIFIANAGMAHYELPGENASWSNIEQIFSINTVSPIYCLYKMAKYEFGRPLQFVLMISGVAGVSIPGYDIYSATKAALDSFAKSYRFSKPDNITLTTVYPVAVKTPFYNNDGNPGVVPLLRQGRRKNAHRILGGIARDKSVVYPSRLYALSVNAMRLFPCLADAYRAIEFARLEEWRERQK